MRTLPPPPHTSTKRYVQRYPGGEPPTLVTSWPDEGTQTERVGR
jgi:hypothetical protein